MARATLAGRTGAGYIGRAGSQHLYGGTTIDMPRLELVAFALFVASGLLPAAAPAHAQKSTNEKRRAIDVEARRLDLESGDNARIVPALEQIRDAGSAAKALGPALEAFLRRGATAKSCVPALEAAAALELPSLSAALAPYVRHRVPTVRRAATKALVKTGGPEAVRALRAALRSNDAVVRAAAAGGLGQIGAKAALPDLVTALDRGVSESAASIGQLCDVATCDSLFERLGKLPLEVLLPGFDQIVFRPAAQLSDDYKIRVIERLREQPAKGVAAYFADAAARWPKGASKRVKKALDEAAKATAGAAPKAE